MPRPMEWLPGLRFDRTALKLAHLYAAMVARQGSIAAYRCPGRDR